MDLDRRRRDLWVQDHGRQAWLEAPLGDSGWWVAALFVVRDGQPVLAELRVFPGGSDRSSEDIEPGKWATPDALQRVPDGGVTTRLLRSIPLGALSELYGRSIEDLFDRLGVQPRAVAALSQLAPPERPGRAGRDDDYYAAWAARYAAKVLAGSRAPLVELAQEHGLERAQVRDLVHKARKRGLLTGGGSHAGSAAGTLTDKALRLLNDVERGRVAEARHQAAEAEAWKERRRRGAH